MTGDRAEYTSSILQDDRVLTESPSLAQRDAAATTTKASIKSVIALSLRAVKVLDRLPGVPTLPPCVFGVNTEPLYIAKGLPVSTRRGGGEGQGAQGRGLEGRSPWTLSASLVPNNRTRIQGKLWCSCVCVFLKQAHSCQKRKWLR